MAGALLLPTEGRVTVDGQSTAGLGSHRLPEFRLKRIGFILQSSNLVPFLRARDHLGLMGYLADTDQPTAKRHAAALLEELGIANRANRYPESMSGGERQRVAIASALRNETAVIVADEPTASLDSARGRQVVEMLSRLVKEGGKAGVMVTHDERLLDLVDRTFHVADGVLTEA